ncbi:MAG: hypothetical protein RBS05_17460 [Zoogloea oleivorans]|uniref:hypothetical protein n=1 Tax=Zoogloea oleivorans TaxID=1552750 RepID=UPI002A35CF58|nr:hypothetical protein [Zoogloea oleivorans]MDY0037701.1 hypothetical protein [Zoogloea oleivorans]
MHSTMKSNSLLIALLLSLVLLIAGCANVRTEVTGGGDLKNYKRAYVEALVEDEFQIYGALFSELTDMGMAVVATPIKEPAETDLIVKYAYDSGWDMTRYLQSFQFQFIEAKTGRVVTIQSYKSRGLWLGVRDGRLKTAFNELRAKNGYPPSKQFP